MTVAAFEVEKQYQGTQTIDLFVELRHKDAIGADATFTFSQRVLTYPAGSIVLPKTDARLGAMSRPVFELSDRRGQIRGVSMTLAAIDDDYLIRGWLDNPFQDNFRAIQVTLWAIPEDQRKALLTPAPLFRGVVQAPEFPADRMVVFTLEDPFTSAFPDKAPFYAIGKTEFPAAPNESLGVTISPCYGDLTDGGVTDAAPLLQPETISGSKVSPDHTVDTDNRAGFASQGGTIATSFELHEQADGLGDFGAFYFHEYFGMVRVTDGGVTGDPQNLLPRNCPTITLGAQDSSIAMSCDDAGVGKTYSFYLGRTFNNIIYWEQRIDTSSPSAVFTRQNDLAGIPPVYDNLTQTPIAAATGPLASDVPQRSVAFAVRARLTGGYTAFSLPFFANANGYGRITRFAVSPVTGALDYQVVATRDGISGGTVALTDWNRQWTVPTTSTNGAGDIVFEYDFQETTGEVIAGLEAPPLSGIVTGVDVGPCQDLSAMTWQRFLFSHGDVKAVAAGYLNGVILDESRYGVDVLLPDKPGFDQMSATRTIDIAGRTFICGFLRAPALDSYTGAAADVKGFAVTCQGVADEDGNLITSIYEQIVHVANNFTVAPVPYASGAWLSPALFADGTPIVDTDSVDAVKARADALIPSGQAAAWFFRTAETAQQLHADLHLSGGVDGGWQPSGQYRIALWDRTATPTRTFTERLDIVKASYSYKGDFQQIETVIPYAAQFDARTNAYLLNDTYEYTPGITKYGRKTIQEGVISFRMRRAIGPCTEMVSLRAQRYGGPLVLAPFDVAGFHALTVLPGDCIALTHTDGPWTDRAVRVQSVAPDADGHVVGLVVEDYRQGTNLVSVEDIMAERSLGGSREVSCHTVGGIVRPYDWRNARVNGALLPSSYTRTARVWIATDAGTVTPAIYDDLGNLIATPGSGVTSSTLTLVEIPLPYFAGVKNYEIRLGLAGGATDLGTVCFGRIDMEP